jgi:plasmid maintenance system antidote protein VapI
MLNDGNINIKQIMRKENITQKDLAKELNVSSRKVYEILKYDLSANEEIRIIDAINKMKNRKE